MKGNRFEGLSDHQWQVLEIFLPSWYVTDMFNRACKMIYKQLKTRYLKLILII
jgi:hypothetical protein